MTKRAVLIGCNAYVNAPLRGCVNDVEDVARMLIAHGYEAKNITLILDGDVKRDRCLDAIKRARDAHRAGDDLFCQNSTHGDQLPTLDPSGEPDGLDECICMVDYNWDRETSIVDDDLHDIFATLDAGGRAVWVADSCHSGTMDRDLQRWSHRFHPAPVGAEHPVHAIRERARRKPVKRPILARTIERLPVAMISGCGSTQTSADAAFNGRANGALTYYLLRHLERYPQASMRQTVKDVRLSLASAGYTQRPELMGHADLIDRPFF